MPFTKPTIQGSLIWTGIFLCALIAQLSPWGQQPTEAIKVSTSQINLIENASVPIFLAENAAAAIAQLENLIQETQIQQVRIYSTDQQQIADVLNSRAPKSEKNNLTASFPIIFQGTLAGSVQMEVVDLSKDVSLANKLIPALARSLIIAVCAWLIATLYKLIRRHLPSTPPHNFKQPLILEPAGENATVPTGSSLLLYIYPLAEDALKQDHIACREFMASFYRRLDEHLQIYGGRILSLADDLIICRMPSGQSSSDQQQALIFTWGIAKPLAFRFNNQQFQLEIKTLLHRTQTPAKSASLYRAISETDSQSHKAITDSSDSAHLSRSMLTSIGNNSDFDTKRIDADVGIYSIIQMKKSLEQLWYKQEKMVGTAQD